MLFQWYKRLRFSGSPLVVTLYQDGIVFYVCLFSRSTCRWLRWFIHVSTAISLINLLVQTLGPVRPTLYFWYRRRVDCYCNMLPFPFIQVETQLIFVTYDLLHVHLLAVPHLPPLQSFAGLSVWCTVYCHVVFSCMWERRIGRCATMRVMSTTSHFSINWTSLAQT